MIILKLFYFHQMLNTRTYVLLIFAIQVILTKKTSDLEERPQFELIKHRPCKFGNGQTWTEKIRFSGGTVRSGARLTMDPNKKGCYSISGDLRIMNNKPKGRLYIHVAIKRSLDPRTLPDPCVDYDQRACGGTGSCLICDTCQSLARKMRVHKSSSIAQKAISLAEASVQVDGELITCKKRWNRGRQKNVNLNFCLPKKRRILRMMGVSEKFWNQFTSGTRRQAAIPLVFTVRIFEKYLNLRNQSGQKLKTQTMYKNSMVLEKMIQREKHLNPSEPLDEEDFYRLPFNVAIYKNRTGFIGCHEIMGRIKIV